MNDLDSKKYFTNQKFYSKVDTKNVFDVVFYLGWEAYRKQKSFSCFSLNAVFLDMRNETAWISLKTLSSGTSEISLIHESFLITNLVFSRSTVFASQLLASLITNKLTTHVFLSSSGLRLHVLKNHLRYFYT